jgi:hypothetical protein
MDGSDTTVTVAPKRPVLLPADAQRFTIRAQMGDPIDNGSRPRYP